MQPTVFGPPSCFSDERSSDNVFTLKVFHLWKINLAPPRVNFIPIHRSPNLSIDDSSSHGRTKIDADGDAFKDIPSEHKINKYLSRMTLGRQI